MDRTDNITQHQMKHVSICIILFISVLVAQPQGTQSSLKFSGEYEFLQLYQLDSLGNSNSIGRYFGSLYFKFLQSLEKQLTPADSATKQFVRRFEKVFAQFYIDASEAHVRHQPIVIEEWRAYFSDSNLQPIQYKLLGTNAHLNGGLWQALTNSFSQEEMNTLKNEFTIFKKSLNQTYKLVYHEAVTNNKRVKNIAKLTIGISQWIGNYYLYKWRKRQMRLARFYWSGSPHYFTLLKKVDRKRKNIDRLILTTL